MFSIWWPAFLLPLAMVLGGVAGGVLPGRKYRGPRGVLPSEEQREADRVFCRFLWQFGLVYAALAFMVMRTVRLVSLSGQRWFLIGAVAVEIIGAALMVIPVERTLHALFGEDSIVTEQAPAKINLALLVGEKHPDGYHDVTSVMQSVSLCDTVTARRTSGGITLTCSDPTLACDETNLAYRAAALFFEETGVEGGAALTLEKVIPMQAGLGGGSSDAAAVLRALRRLYAPDMPLEELERMAIRLGSDVPYCVRGATTLVEGARRTFDAADGAARLLVRPLQARHRLPDRRDVRRDRPPRRAPDARRAGDVARAGARRSRSGLRPRRQRL